MGAVVVVLAALQAAWVLGEAGSLFTIVGNGSVPTTAMALLWLGTLLLCGGAVRFALDANTGARTMVAALVALLVAAVPLDPIYLFLLPYVSGIAVTLIALLVCFIVRRSLSRKRAAG